MFVANPMATDHENRYASVRLTYDGYEGNAVEVIPQAELALDGVLGRLV